jgi:transmembrane 9 superfamily protein 2/4
MGDTIQNSGYDLRMKSNITCKVLCTRGGSDSSNPALTSADVNLLVQRIKDEYNVNMMVDNLPVAATGLLVDGTVLYAHGVPVGDAEVDTGSVFLYNHYRFTIKYHEEENYEGARVVGVEVKPVSVFQTDKISQRCDQDGNPPKGMDQTQPRMILTGPNAPKDKDVKITFSYDVFWVPSPVSWASRWDIYLTMGNRYSDNIHWYSIFNSLIIAVFLTGIVALIMVRVLRLDIQRYNRVMTEEEKAEQEEERGWKLVHGDVFRPPSRLPTLFAIFVGIGAQIVAMSFTTLIMAAIGFLSPANRGYLVIALLVLFLGFASIAGYVTARTYKMFGGTFWQRTTVVTALGFPGFLFTVLCIINAVVFSTGSTNAVPFTSMLAVMAMWLILSVPLVFFGAHVGFKADKVEPPTRISTMPRQIPPQPWYLRTPLVMLVGGLLPFGTVFVELVFILNSFWGGQYYYVFGFLLLVFLLLLITSAEISIMLTYFQLCAEDYQWWWKSFLVPAASGCYLYAYCIYFFFMSLNIDEGVPQLLYFSYMGLIALAFSFVTGTVGYMSTSSFVRSIYGSVRVD